MRRCEHKKEKRRAYREISAPEIRLVVDGVLSGRPVAEIAKGLGREKRAVRSIMDKVLGNYAGEPDNPRTPMLERLVECPSLLDRDRVLTRRDYDYFNKAWNRRRTVKQISVILHVSEDTVEQMRRESHRGETPKAKGFFS
jgi:hypothetical protein